MPPLAANRLLRHSAKVKASCDRVRTWHGSNIFRPENGIHPPYGWFTPALHMDALWRNKSKSGKLPVSHRSFLTIVGPGSVRRGTRENNADGLAGAAGVVDFVLPPEEIAKRLVRITRHPYVALKPEEIRIDDNYFSLEI